MQFYLEGGRRVTLIALILSCIIVGPMFLASGEPAIETERDERTIDCCRAGNRIEVSQSTYRVTLAAISPAAPAVA